MRTVHVDIRRVGNSQGIIIPKPVLAQLGLNPAEGIEMTVENDALILRKPLAVIRKGWAEASQKIAAAGDDALVMGEFANDGDADLVW